MMDLDEEVDEDSDNRLLEWAKKLDKTKGELSIKRIVRTMYDWTARRMADAKELLIEKNRYGAIWLHFAVRPKDNRRKIMILSV